MARRPRSDDPAAVGVRGALIAKLASHVRLTVDPRMVMVPKDEWPDPMPVYVDPKAALLDDLKAGRPVDVSPLMLKGIADVPPGCWLVRVDARGVVTAAPYERVR